MRFTSLFVALTGILSLTNALAAADAPPPDVRTIGVPQAQVWCGPSTADGLYPTNVLHQGDRVQVERELTSGWLVIRPPAGSFSWINNRFVQHISDKYANYVVTYNGYDVPVLIGSNLKTDRPNKIGVKLPRGAQVRVIGHGMTDEEGIWLPIEPPEGEVRYLRKESISGATQTTAAKATVPAPDGDALWRDAQKADNAGRLADAVRLYRLAGDANLSINPSRADEAYQRARLIEQGSGSTAAPASGSHYYTDGHSPSIAPYVLPVNPVGANAVQPIGGAAPGTVNGQLVSTRAVPAAIVPTVTVPTATVPAAAANAHPTYYEKGRLKRAWKNAQTRRYHLLDNQGNPFRSVVAGPGVDLTRFEDHNVELWGLEKYDFDRRNYLMTVTQVRELP